MGHIAVLAGDGVGLHLIAVLVLVPTAGDDDFLLVAVEVAEAVEVDEHTVGIGGDIVALAVGEVKDYVAPFVQSLVVAPLSCDEFQFSAVILDIAGELPAVLVARRMEVDEEVDDGGKEVLGGVLEEGFGAAFLLATAFVEGGQKGGCCLGSCRQVGNVLPLNGVHTIRVLHISEVDDAEAAVPGQRALLAVLAVLVEEVAGQCRELIVIDHHGKALGTVLADERVDDPEGLTRAGRTQDDGGAERVDDVDPAVVQFLLVVIDHRDIDAVLVLFLVTALLKALIVEIPFIITNLHAQVLRDGIKALVDEHRTNNGTEDIETAVEGITGKGAVEGHAVEDEAQDYHGRSSEDRIEHHRLEISLQALPRSRADAGNGDADEFHHLAGSHRIEDLEAVEELKDECNHGVGGRDGQVHHDLYNQYQVDARAEHVVHLLLFTGFFHGFKELGVRN